MTKDICGVSKNKDVDIVDRYERRINYLRVSITDRCNLRCIYCMPYSGISQVNCGDILRYEEILRIIRISVKAGIDKIRITGGEPLVRKGVVGFIRDVAAIEGIRDLSLTTNGIMLERMAGDLYDAGLKRINISLDSMKAPTFKKITRHDCLDKVMAGLARAYETGFSPIKINAVIIRGLNDDEIVDFAKLTEERPYSVRFIEYMPIGDRNNWDKNLFVSSEEIRKKISLYGELEPVKKSDKSSPSSDYALKGAKGTIGFISPISQHFCVLCNRLRLMADGKLRSCLFSEDEIDLKTALRNGKSDEELSGIIRKAILSKPEGHEEPEGSDRKKRAMYSIGG